MKDEKIDRFCSKPGSCMSKLNSHNIKKLHPLETQLSYLLAGVSLISSPFL